MSFLSVNTNVGAQVALRSLNATNTQLQATQKRVSTGYRVADATDDGGAFAIAQGVRASVGALTTANQQLGNAQGLVGRTVSALTSLSDSLVSAKSLLVQIADASISDDQRNQYVASYFSVVTQAANTVDGSTYNGQTLLGTATGNVFATPKTVISSDTGATISLSAENNRGLAPTLASLLGGGFNRGSSGADISFIPNASAAQISASNAIRSSGGVTLFGSVQSALANQLNQAGADANLLSATIASNSDTIDSLNAGLGALVDADLGKEAANLQALQVRQQLGTQALSLANQAPQSLLRLFA